MVVHSRLLLPHIRLGHDSVAVYTHTPVYICVSPDTGDVFIGEPSP